MPCCYRICYCKAMFIVCHEVVCSCILSRLDRIRSRFERCWNPLAWDSFPELKRLSFAATLFRHAATHDITRGFGKYEWGVRFSCSSCARLGDRRVCPIVLQHASHARYHRTTTPFKVMLDWEAGTLDAHHVALRRRVKTKGWRDGCCVIVWVVALALRC